MNGFLLQIENGFILVYQTQAKMSMQVKRGKRFTVQVLGKMIKSMIKYWLLTKNRIKLKLIRITNKVGNKKHVLSVRQSCWQIHNTKKVFILYHSTWISSKKVLIVQMLCKINKFSQYLLSLKRMAKGLILMMVINSSLHIKNKSIVQ